jgi:CRISPR-associated protein Cas1
MNDNYHIFRDGTLSREENTLRFDSDDDSTYIPVESVEAIYAHGQITYNTRLLAFLDQKQIELHVFDWTGSYAGSFLPNRGQTSGKAVVKQVEAYLSQQHRLTIAAAFVQGSIHNMANIVSYRQRQGGASLSHIKERVNAVASELDQCETVAELLGMEASVRKTYYDLYRTETPGEFDFDVREYYPPPDPVNALISYGNAILYSQCLSAIRTTTLDPAVSYLHEPGDRRCSLALDIADIFKPVFIDRLLLRLLNRRQVMPSDFTYQGSACSINESARKTLLKEFETVLDETIEHPDLHRHVSYQHLLQLEVYKLKRHLLTGESYTAFKKWW